MLAGLLASLGGLIPTIISALLSAGAKLFLDYTKDRKAEQAFQDKGAAEEAAGVLIESNKLGREHEGEVDRARVIDSDERNKRLSEFWKLTFASGAAASGSN